jgi:hypothetical protein
VDQEVDRALIKAQLAVFQQAALHLHHHGLSVYIREGTDGLPMRIRSPRGKLIAAEQQCPPFGTAARRLQLFPGPIRCPLTRLREPQMLIDSGVRAPFEGFPIELVLGPDGKRLLLFPEIPLQDEGKPAMPKSYMLLDPEREAHEFSGFLRLSQGKPLNLGTSIPEQIAYFGLSGCVAEVHASLRMDRNTIAVRDSSGVGTRVSPTLSQHSQHCLARLSHLRDIFGGPLEPLPAGKAQDLIQRVLKIMKKEP